MAGTSTKQLPEKGDEVVVNGKTYVFGDGSISYLELAVELVKHGRDLIGTVSIHERGGPPVDLPLRAVYDAWFSS